ncbi:hypothetical protein [Escherichia coli]|uniref:hypothetical protein n=1 Tax=Escherichia coli TaxID=562 RepID=UPI0012FF8330|nr:hypothetical protein [Escherichia coli]
MLGVKVITSSQPYTPTPGTKNLIVEMISGGGGSFTITTASNVTGGSQAGFAGQYIKALFDTSALTFPIAVTIGAGGAIGARGGDSSFGSDIVLGGGAAGGSATSNSGPFVIGGAYRGVGTICTTTGLVIASTKGETISLPIMQVTAGTSSGYMALSSEFPGGYYGRGGNGRYADAGTTTTGEKGIDGIAVILELG